MIRQVLLASCSLLLMLVIAGSSSASSESGTITVHLHDNYVLAWTVSEDHTKVIFEATVRTKGYVGVGLSTNGAMIGADIVIGGVKDNGDVYFDDYHGGTQNGMPTVDKVSNYDLLSATENGTHTQLKFERLLDTCDDEDIAITEANLRIIWSYGTTDDITYHGANSRGAKSAYILDPEVPVPDLSQLMTFDIVSNFTMPTKKTTYRCSIHQLPDLVGDHQMIAYDVLLPTPASRKHAHHMNVLKCFHGLDPDGQYGEWAASGQDVDCNDYAGTGFPGDTCLFLEYGWALGGEIAVNPPEVGFPFKSRQYLKLEVHLDNPELLEDVQVSTGFRVYYTNETKNVTGGLIMVSAPVDFHQMIPPNSSEFVTVAHCMPMCTDIPVWPKEGVTAYNAFLHAHTSARKMRIRHFRGSVELPWMINDENYNFNYQTNRRFPNTVTILPGDQITAECTYDTNWKGGKSVIGGQSTDDEMCMVFIAYYPAVPNFVGCQDAMTAKTMLKILGVDKIGTSGKDPLVLEPIAHAGKKISQVVEEFNWTAEIREEYQWYARYGPHLGVCLPRIALPVGGYPHVDDYSPEATCKRDGDGDGDGSGRSNSLVAEHVTVLLLGLLALALALQF